MSLCNWDCKLGTKSLSEKLKLITLLVIFLSVSQKEC